MTAGKVLRTLGGALMASTLAACGGATEPTPVTTSTSDAPEESTAAPQAPAARTTAIRITFGDTVLRGELWDSSATQSLIDQLPLTMDFRDLNGVEKVGHMTTPLTMDGMPPGDDPQPQDIGWYAPSDNLVLYYGDVSYWNGIARIGRMLDDAQPLAEQTDGFQATIELDR